MLTSLLEIEARDCPARNGAWFMMTSLAAHCHGASTSSPYTKTFLKSNAQLGDVYL